jgi:hypothetical protein
MFRKYMPGNIFTDVSIYHRTCRHHLLVPYVPLAPEYKGTAPYKALKLKFDISLYFLRHKYQFIPIKDSPN